MNLTFWTPDPENSEEQLLARVREGYFLKQEAFQEGSGSLWDSVDQQYLRKGQSILKKGNQWQMWDLPLWAPLGEPTQKRLSEKTPKVWQQFDQGSFRNTLRKDLDLWSINKLMDFQWKERELSILNGEEKRVAALTILQLDRQVLLKAAGLRGYDEEYKGLTDLLSASGCSSVGEDWISGMLYKQDINLFHEIPLDELIPTGEIPIRRTVSDMILNYLHTARFFEKGVIQDLDTECLHTYRVSLRKIRSLLSIIKEIYPPEDWRMLKQEFRELQQETNHLRDLDVFLLEEDRYTDLLPEQYRPLLSPLFLQARQERKGEFLQVKGDLQTGEYKEKMRDLEAYFERVYKIPHTPESRKTTKEVAQSLIRKIYRKMAKEIRQIHGETPDVLIHDLRITGKKLRYLLEFFDPILDYDPKEKLLKSLKKIQNDLGRFNDLSVQIGHLSEKAETIPEKEKDNLLPLGILIGVLHHQYQMQREQVLRNLRSFITPRVRGAVRDLTE